MFRFARLIVNISFLVVTQCELCEPYAHFSVSLYTLHGIPGGSSTESKSLKFHFKYVHYRYNNQVHINGVSSPGPVIGIRDVYFNGCVLFALEIILLHTTLATTSLNVDLDKKILDAI